MGLTAEGKAGAAIFVPSHSWLERGRLRWLCLGCPVSSGNALPCRCWRSWIRRAGMYLAALKADGTSKKNKNS